MYVHEVEHCYTKQQNCVMLISASSSTIVVCKRQVYTHVNHTCAYTYKECILHVHYPGDGQVEEDQHELGLNNESKHINQPCTQTTNVHVLIQLMFLLSEVPTVIICSWYMFICILCEWCAHYVLGLFILPEMRKKNTRIPTPIITNAGTRNDQLLWKSKIPLDVHMYTCIKVLMLSSGLYPGGSIEPHSQHHT